MADKAAKKKKDSSIYRKTANFFSITMIIFLSASFFFETKMAGVNVNFGVYALIVIVAAAVAIAIIRNTINYYKLAFNVPFVILLFYTLLMMISGWHVSHYFLVCLALSTISCLYSSFQRSVVFIIVMHLLIGFLILRGFHVSGRNVTLFVTLINWSVCLMGGIVMIVLTRAATVSLSRALEHRNSFRSLLASTENYIAMVDERNEIVYASKTLAQLSGIENETMVQGRPVIDIFPGRTLKLYAGKMLKEKENYAEDWEFTLNGQKRYFKVASHNLPGYSGSALISLYDMTYLAERDEIAVMKDSMKIGLFFMDQNFVIQDHYSRYLEDMLVENNLAGRLFTDIISSSVTPNELEAIKDYFGMIFERSYDQDMLDDINPLNELRYINVTTGDRKVLQCAFATIERGHGEVFLLVTVYDITIRVELQEKLAEEESKRQEEMQSVFELIQVEPDVFGDFMEDMEYEFGNIDKILKDDTLVAHDVLVKTYQSVHAIKSNAVILGLNVFGNKVHNLESKIKKLREQQGTVPFVEMLNLTVDIEKISQEREGFREIISKLQSYGGGGGAASGGQKQNIKVLIDSLAKTTSRASEDMGKTIKFIAADIDPEAIDKGPRRVMKEVLMQLIRNSVVHGVETPEVRKAKGKSETGAIKLSIKMSDDHKNIHIKLTDDGNGLDYKKIAQKAISKKMIKKEDASNRDILLKVIFAPGFSTAETEGVHAGRGIGLNLVRDRIKEVNGTMKLRSEDGKGTLFFISIPVAQAPAQTQQAKTQPQAKAPAQAQAKKS